MSLKLISVLIILTLAAIVLVVEARGGRGRGGSSIFYRRSYKKHSPSRGTSSRREFVSGSPVHTAYTKSLTGHSLDQKLARHSSRRGSKHKSSGGHGFFSGLFSSKSHSSSSSHHSGTHAYTPSHTNSHPHTYHHNTEYRTNGWHLHSSGPAHHSSPAVGSYVSHTWGGQQLKPGHVYVAHPSSIPANAVYYAQPPQYSSNTGDTKDFALGYLIGQSSSHGHHHHHYYNHQTEPQQANSYSTNTNIDSSANTNPTPLPDLVKNNHTNQTNYWPTDYEVSLAPLNNTLLPETVAEHTQTTIFKKPPIVTAQTLSTNNITFQLPTAAAAPPETPPIGGIICMPWSFNETDPTHPENVVIIEKTICFPAPSPPPPTTTTTTTTMEVPIAGDIGEDNFKSESREKDSCKDKKCPLILDVESWFDDPCCLHANLLLLSNPNIHDLIKF